MSFIYLPGQEAEYLPENYSDTDASAPLKSSHTHKPCSLPDSEIKHSSLSRFGMTCKHLTEDRGAELLTSWLAGFPVRTSALPEKAQDLMVSVVDCGATSPASLARYDPATHSLKTAQCSLNEDLTGCCVTLPRSGLMRNGVCFQHQIVELHTSEIESGFWPTPTRDSATQRTKRYAQGGMPLSAAVTMFPTPTARDWKSGKASAATMAKNSRPLSEQIGGLLNPDWVEWLIGWPIGHTDLKPLETGRLAEWRLQHSIYY